MGDKNDLNPLWQKGMSGLGYCAIHCHFRTTQKQVQQSVPKRFLECRSLELYCGFMSAVVVVLHGFGLSRRFAPHNYIKKGGVVCPKLHKERVSDQLNGFLERLTLLARLGMTPLALSPAIEHKVRHPGSGTDRVGPA